jgi:hypothetical protein
LKRKEFERVSLEKKKCLKGFSLRRKELENV